jgi:hypothetical protein
VRLTADNLPESMSLVRRAIPFFVALVVVAPGQAATKPKPEPPPAPANLHGFLLRADEPESLKRDVFPRTPSFTWNPVPGVLKYEFELATSKRFIEAAQVWAGEVAGTPAVSIPVALPWMSGKPYALYARVRTVSTTGRSPWSEPFGFNMQADRAPQMENSYPGLVRWKPVDGATSYEVWWTDLSKRITTLTNSADEREHYMFRQISSVVHWRVRAVRSVYGDLPSGLPAVSYGPWSGPLPYESVNPPFPVGPLNLSTSVSANVQANSEASTPHKQTPAFLFGTNTLAGLESGFLYSDVKLYRVYVFTDRDCVNLVFRGAIVGSPAYSPRTSGSLALPHGFTPTFDPSTLKTTPTYLRDALRDGDEGLTQMADLSTVVSSEVKKASSSSSSGSSSEEPPTTPPVTPPAAETPPSTTFTLPEPEGALVDLWDSGWPTGLYYWTVVPVNLVYDFPDAKSQTRQWIYRDTWVPQETCAAGLTGEFGNEFGKESDPVLISESGTPSPYVSGLTTDGRIESAKQEKPVFYGTPLVAWTPAMGAAAYEVQWSKAEYPWSTEGTVFTFGTSALLQDKGKTLAPGEWFYRVRGLDPFLAGPVKVMSWSTPVPIVVAKPVFKVLKGTPKKKEAEETKATFRTYPESGFAVALPTQWKKVKANPSAKFYLAKGALEGLSTGGTSLRFMANDPGDKSHTTGASVAYIPTVQQGQQQYGHETWVKAVKATVAKQKRLVGKPYCVESSLPTGPTLKCAYSFRVASSKLVESEVSYWFDTPGKTWVLALTNPRGVDKAKASLRLSIAKKFKVIF